MTTSLYWSVGAVGAVEWARVLCGRHIQNDWASRATNLHQILLSLDIPSRKLFRWLRRPQLWTTGDWQLHHNNTPAHGSRLMQTFFCETSNHPMIQPPYSPDLVPCDFWLFPKLKSPLRGKRFQSVDEIQGNTTGQLMTTGRTCEVPECLLWRDWGVIILCTVFLVSTSINVSIFRSKWLDTF